MAQAGPAVEAGAAAVVVVVAADKAAVVAARVVVAAKAVRVAHAMEKVATASVVMEEAKAEASLSRT